MESFDLFILGTGPAATRIASKCSEAGWHVGIVDPRPFGGTCALRGCNPKKVFVRAAELYDWIQRAEGTGVRALGASIDWAELMRFKRTFTDPVTAWKEDKFEKAGIARFHGHPRFVATNRITIDGRTMESRKFVVATGAVPVRLQIPGADLLATSDDFLELDHLPGRILFVGGGYVTFEFAHVAARAGAKVTIVEMGVRPLARFDAELVDCLVDRTRQLGITLHTSTKVGGVQRLDNGVLSVDLAGENGNGALEVDLVVHGAGRVPNTDGLDLEKGDVRFGPPGIEVNEFLQSVSNPDVYAAGDVAATKAPPLSPAASHEGRIVAKNLLEGNLYRCDYGLVPTVVFSVPPLAAVGMREDDARQAGREFTIESGDRSTNNSMKKVGAKHARYKLLVERGSGRILGAHLLGPDAAETINLFALAMNYGITATDLKGTLFAFPTFSHDVRSMI